jgi:hypothetical protein
MNSSELEKCFWKTFYRKSKHIFMLNNFSPENRAVEEIMWKNMVQPDRPQMAI